MHVQVVWYAAGSLGLSAMIYSSYGLYYSKVI